MKTEAGKRLLAQIVVEDGDDAEWVFPLDPEAAIAAIEAEAVSDADREIARLWMALKEIDDLPTVRRGDPFPVIVGAMRRIARTALGGSDAE